MVMYEMLHYLYSSRGFIYIRWNLYIKETLGPAIFSEVENTLKVYEIYRLEQENLSFI